MLMKAAQIDRGIDIRNPKNGFTHTIRTLPQHCYVRSEGNAFCRAKNAKTLNVLDGLRNEAQHFIADVSEQVVYIVAQSAVTTVCGPVFPGCFGRSLCEFVPKRVLPISVVPPKDIESVNGR